MKRNRGYQILANTVMLLVTALVILPFVLLPCRLSQMRMCC